MEENSSSGAPVLRGSPRPERKNFAGKHTPAPWVIVEYGDGDSLAIHDARGDWRVCFMATPGETRGAVDDIEANARLIAAAPDLLEALKNARDCLFVAVSNSADLQGFDPAEHVAIKRADLAIARAEGRPQ